jgi:hypothetical protein
VKGAAARLAARASLVIAALLVLLAVRVLVGAQDELRRAEQLRAAGDVDAAVVHYRRAARLYVPAGPHVGEALGALASIAREAESAGASARALAAWRSVHAAILASRSFYVPHEAALAEADARIAALVAAEPPAVDAARPVGVREAAYRRALTRAAAADPSRLAVFVLLAGFAGWVGGALALLLRGFDSESRVRMPEVRRSGLVMLVGFVGFVAGLAFA